jgi:hypothetical protein
MTSSNDSEISVPCPDASELSFKHRRIQPKNKSWTATSRPGGKRFLQRPIEFPASLHIVASDLKWKRAK